MAENKITYRWFCFSCGELTDVFLDQERICHKPSIRLLFEKKGHRICMDCVNAAIILEHRTNDMKKFLNTLGKKITKGV